MSDREQSTDFHRKCCDALADMRKEFFDRQKRAHGICGSINGKPTIVRSGEKAFDPQVIEEIGADLDELFRKHGAKP